jgi:hypothetical protein
MTESATSAKTKSNGTKAGELSEAMREELVASVKQAQQFTLDALTTWVDVVGKVVPPPLAFPFAPARSEVLEGFGTAFDMAQELLTMQRKFASELIDVLVPAS